ncbi:MAG: hypothetical protein ACXQT5_02590 [Candidatus Syntropharchaeia archaeon]
MKKGWEGLKESVIERGLCTGCVGICPYIKTMRGRCHGKRGAGY